MNLMYLVLGIIIGFALAWFIKKSQLANQNIDESKGLKDFLSDENLNLKKQLELKQEEIIAITKELTSAKGDLKNVETRLTEQKTELTNLREQFTKEFENLANRIFEEKSKKFTDQNKTNLDALLTPLGIKIKEFETKVNDVYVKESSERASLKEQLTMLHQLNQQMSKEASNLTKALKGETNNKFQGNWGEIILESILEKSGLVKDREYIVQMSLTTEDGKRFQPDIVVNLPDGKHLVIDSKISLNAYERFSSAESDDERQIALKEHLISVKKHIKDLSDKNYQSLYQLKTLDFVLLFIPIEPAFALSVQGDAQIFNEAFDKNIVIVSPSTMLATLRTVASIWRQEKQNRNSIEIAKLGGMLYDRLYNFVEELISVGSKMDQTKNAYTDAMRKLTGNTTGVIRTAERLKSLGSNTTKSLRQELINRTDEDTIE